MQTAIEKGKIVVFLSGLFSRVEAKELHDIILKAVSGDTPTITLDMKELSSIDSIGIGMLVKELKALRAQNGDLVLRNLSDDVAGLFHESSLDLLFKIQQGDSLSEAQEDLFAGWVDLKLEIQLHKRGETGVLSFTGMMNSPDGVRLFKEQMLIGMAEHKKFVLDFTNLTYLDSGSVSALMIFQRVLSSSGGKICAANGNELVKELFQTTSLHKIVPLYPSLEKALELV